MSDPAVFPASALRFAGRTETRDAKVARLSENGQIWIDMPILEKGDQVIGRLQIFYIAEFNFWIQLRTVLEFFFSIWSSLLALSVPIGIACGLVAARYVTRQLHEMNAVTERWRQGNFEARIALPNDDVLIRHSRHLNDMAQDLEMYFSLRQTLAVSDERNRVARELHDTVKQKLFALSLQLATAKAKPTVIEAAGEHILEAETLTREAQHDLMEIITQLRPAGTDQASLQERITLIVEDFKRRFDIGIAVSHGDLICFNAPTEHHVLRIIQEALMNSVRHGMATHIAVAIGVDRDRAILTITDNGIGFDTGEKTKGFGLTSMRDRVRDLPQGTLDIKSAAGIGTEITLTWKHDS